MTSQFDLTRFCDVMIRNSVFKLSFFNSGIPDPIHKIYNVKELIAVFM